MGCVFEIQFCLVQRACLFLVLLAGISVIGVTSEEIPHKKIIIVGAGISGFGAATRLLENNMTNFLILEAENRMGGRINSVKMGGTYVDLGAEYVHGQDGNLVYELSKKYMKPNNDMSASKLYYSNNEEIDNTLLQGFFETFAEMKQNPGAPNVSLHESFSKRYRNTILPKYEGNRKMTKIAHEFLKTIELILLTLEGTFNWYVVRNRFNSFKVYPGNPVQSWSGLGYKTIFDVLREKIGPLKSKMLDDRILLNTTVTSIINRGGNKENIYIECHDGTKYTADHLIFTASLGVLKHDHKKLFQPELDGVKLRAMSVLGYGAIIKVALLFSQSWWKFNGDIFLLWSEEDEKNLLNDVPFGPSKNGKHWLSGFHSLTPAPNNSKVLTAWIAGPFVPEVEQLSDKELKEGLMYGMRKFFGKNHNISEPVEMKRSHWYSNPHFRGSWSSETPEVGNVKGSPHSDLLQPIVGENGVPRILFAGEVTHPTRFSCVDGALDTGFMQADRLMKYYSGSRCS